MHDEIAQAIESADALHLLIIAIADGSGRDSAATAAHAADLVGQAVELLGKLEDR